jgi:branched-chain amino acid transport system permease protein
VAVAVVCAAVGALVALPALRLKGLYLALATMAFALFCEKAVFAGVEGFSQGDASFPGCQIGPIDTSATGPTWCSWPSTFALLGLLVTLLRRGPFGRRFQAMKDSPAACATLGLDLTRLKLQAFALSAAIAGMGGALLGGWRGKVGTEQFSLLQGALPGLPLVLMAVVGGIASVAGVLLGAVLLALMPLVGDTIPALRNLMTVLPASPASAWPPTPTAPSPRRSPRCASASSAGRSDRRPSPRAGARSCWPDPPRSCPRSWPSVGSAAAVDLAAFDDEVGLSWGRCDVDPRST